MGSCLRSGYCCKQAPCPFGEWDDAKKQCRFLAGPGPGEYRCEIYEWIQEQPGAWISPAFGAGCCSPLNGDRRQLRETPENRLIELSMTPDE